MTAEYEKGLVEIGDGLHAYLQPDGSWGYSNAGLVVGDGGSALIDTLFDLRLTQEMLDAMAAHTASAPIGDVVNTHANGDHCYGNQLLAQPGVSFHASAAAASEIDDVPPALLASMMSDLPAGEIGDFMRHAFGPFEFEGIEMPPITDAFTGSVTLDVAGRTMELIEVGPAHTGGDVLAWLPDERTVFTGDILFIEGTPIMWAGPIGNWIDACDLIEQLDPVVVVPGHGPLTDVGGARTMGHYLRHVRDGVVSRHAAGMDPLETTRDLDAEINSTPFAGWGDRERLVVTVHAMWRELEPGYEMPGAGELFPHMASAFAARRRVVG